MAKDPNAHLLTDSGLIDAAARERAVFGDPWLFHLLAETGQINPETILRRIDSQYYDLIVTTSDLMLPGYAITRVRIADCVCGANSSTIQVSWLTRRAFLLRKA